jgi:hypothetical protein
MYWRSAALYANRRGFVTASENRIELTDCLSSIDDVISKVIGHLNVDASKPIFDIRHSDTKIEDDLSTQFDEIKDVIFKAANIGCLRRVPLFDYHLNVAYFNYTSFLVRGFAEITQRTESDFSGRFNLDTLAFIRTLLAIRSSIMTARTRNDFNNFVSLLFFKFIKFDFHL